MNRQFPFVLLRGLPVPFGFQELRDLLSLLRRFHGFTGMLPHSLRIKVFQKHAALRQTSRQSKITYFGVAIGRDKNVCGFDVSVHYISVMDESK